MKTILWLAGLVVMAWFLAGCDADVTSEEDGAYTEDKASYDTNVDDDTVEPNESPPESDVVYDDNTADTTCDPPWPDGTKVHCNKFVVDYCELSWNKESCTASCLDPDDSAFLFSGCPAEAVSAQWPDGYGCAPLN